MIKVYGNKDNSVAIRGDIEANIPQTNWSHIAFSDGTILKMTKKDGLWTIEAVNKGACDFVIERNGGDATPNFTDVVDFGNEFRIYWVVPCDQIHRNSRA